MIQDPGTIVNQYGFESSNPRRSEQTATVQVGGRTKQARKTDKRASRGRAEANTEEHS